MNKHARTAVICALLAMSASRSAASGPGWRAFATFEIDHGNQCSETSATIEVVLNPDADPDVVTFHYDVFGQPLSPGCDGLWYYFLDGVAPLNPGEFAIGINGKSARLLKVMQVYDDESGTWFNVTLDATWTRLRGETAATLSVSAPEIGSGYTIDPLSPATAAGLVRVKRSGA